MTDSATGPLPVLARRYRALEQLGAGGMGVVWRARDELLHREVAIKEVRLDPNLPEAQRAETLKRTLREARAAARLAHPSIVAVHDVVDQDDRPWIVMDLVRGRSLDQVIRAGGPLPPRRVASIGLAVLDALTLAHSRGIMHRDVKPANIMLSDDGEVLLTDFGIATLEGDVQLTSPDALVGSPGYIAPERLRGVGDGPGADLWSLGATLYAAVEGRGPFQRATPVAALGAVLTQEAPFPSRAGELAPVLLAMLARDPGHRPGGPGLRRALHQVARGLPVEPLSPPAQSRETEHQEAEHREAEPRTESRPVPAAGTRAASPAGPRRTGAVAGTALAVVAAGVAATVLLTTRGGHADPAASAGRVASAGPATSAGPTASTEPATSTGRTGPAAPANPADPGRFATAPDPCSLLTDAQAGAVIPGASPRGIPATGDEEASCTWDDSGGDLRIRVSLTPHRPTPGKNGPETARSFFASERSRIAADAGQGPLGSVNPLRDVRGVGEEAFTYDVTSLDYINSSVLRFRYSNLLVEVNLSATDRPLTAGLRRTTLRTARLVAGELKRR
ncbi:hypothetical protein FHS43_001094 [Streptosporangium becharense]|uniref:non-specific serine/threonine protein kinase n=1 Tax=Streptosporangium becharense TaxID=1816182 RepID=A0A7W9IEE0_9ACTN|nr:serine/threonine-protein kinase [Streptosporangium becharense]MBB2909848.1 hypothetical protein [Streptosporangium becharense]MBB5819197.1 hypothetical protein [Streptosporangium becharense]